MNKLITLLTCLLLATSIDAIEKKGPPLVKDLLNDNYTEMTPQQFRQQLINKELVIIDLQSGAEYEVTLQQNKTTKLKKIKEEKPSTLTDPDYQGRPTLLKGDISFKVEGDNFISTDGIRVYTIKLYKKGDKILGVRDVDYGQANFQIKLK